MSRDLRDSNNLTFGSDAVTDLINWAIVEVNRVYPVMDTWSLPVTLDENSSYNTVITAPDGLVEVSRIEVWRNNRLRLLVPVMTDYPGSGWDLFGSDLILPGFLTLDADLDTIKVYGYRDRDTVTDVDTALDVDAEAERAIRLFAVARGFMRLQSDRALFTQWMNMPGNTDVSPTQLDGMSNTYMADWERYRKHMRRLRR